MKNPKDFRSAVLAARLMHEPKVPYGRLLFIVYRPSWRASDQRGFKDFVIRFQSRNVLDQARGWRESKDLGFLEELRRVMNWYSDTETLYGQLFQTA